jgi:hypothetical protein
MPIDYVARPDEGFVEVVWSGTITAHDLRMSWSKILCDPAVLRIGQALTDIRDATLAFSGAELAEVVLTVAAPALKGRQWRAAILVCDRVQFGVSRQYEALTAQFGEDSIFFDRDAALSWLLQKPSAHELDDSADAR